MNKLIFLICILLPAIAIAGPTLVSDPNINATENEILICVNESICDESTGTLYGPYTAESDGSISLDLGPLNLPDGEVEFQARAINIWGVSEWSLPLSVTKQEPASPSNLTLAP